MLAAAKYYELHLSPLSKVVRLSQRTTRYVSVWFRFVIFLKVASLLLTGAVKRQASVPSEAAHSLVGRWEMGWLSRWSIAAFA